MSFRNRHSHTLAVACISSVLAITCALTGCKPTTDPTPTPTPAFATEEDAYAAAEETYRAYINAFNKVDLSKPESFEPVFQFTTGDYEATEREDLSAMHADGNIRGGAIEIISFNGTGFKEMTITARSCNDVASTTFTDKDGNSLVSSTRAPRVAIDLTFTIVDGSPMLSAAEATKDDTCTTL